MWLHLFPRMPLLSSNELSANKQQLVSNILEPNSWCSDSRFCPHSRTRVWVGGPHCVGGWHTVLPTLSSHCGPHCARWCSSRKLGTGSGSGLSQFWAGCRLWRFDTTPISLPLLPIMIWLQLLPTMILDAACEDSTECNDPHDHHHYHLGCRLWRFDITLSAMIIMITILIILWRFDTTPRPSAGGRGVMSDWLGLPSLAMESSKQSQVFPQFLMSLHFICVLFTETCQSTNVHGVAMCKRHSSASNLTPSLKQGRCNRISPTTWRRTPPPSTWCGPSASPGSSSAASSPATSSPSTSPAASWSWASCRQSCFSPASPPSSCPSCQTFLSSWLAGFFR